MIAQIAFTMDKEIKNKFFEKCKEKWISMKTALTILAWDFANWFISIWNKQGDGSDITTEENDLAYKRAKKDFAENKNIVSSEHLHKKYS